MTRAPSSEAGTAKSAALASARVVPSHGAEPATTAITAPADLQAPGLQAVAQPPRSISPPLRPTQHMHTLLGGRRPLAVHWVWGRGCFSVV